MRRTFSLVLLLALLFLLAPSTHAEDEASDKKGLTPAQVARMILVGGEGQQAFAAQYLEGASVETVRAVQDAIRKLAPTLAKRMQAEAGQDLEIPAKGPVTVVNIETRILETKGGTNFLRDVGVSDGEGKRFTFLDDTQREVILRAVEKSERIEQITAPRITVYDRQRANVSLLNQVSYVQDYDIEVAQDEFIADPIIGIVQDGMTIDVRPVVSKEQRHITLDIDVTWAHLERPMKERKIVFREGAEPVTIQLPEIEVGGVNANATIPTGGTILLSSPAVYGNGKEKNARFVLITAEVLSLDAKVLRESLPPKDIEVVPPPAPKPQPAAEDDEQKGKRVRRGK